MICYLTITAKAAENNFIVIPSPHEVTINEKKYVEKDAYTTLFYNNVVYIPMTYDIGESVGRNIEWIEGYEQDVLLLTEKENIVVKNGVKKNETKPQAVSAEFVDCVVAVCVGENLNFIRGTEDYPLLRHKDIIYIPLTWENIVENFGWSYSFDKINGLNINVYKSNISETFEKDIYISEDGSTTCYILEKRNYIDSDGFDSTDWFGIVRCNYEIKGKDLMGVDMGEFIIEKEISHPIQQGDLRFFKNYKVNEFKAPEMKESWRFLYAATTMMLDARTGSINKWGTLPSWRRSVIENNEKGIISISMSGTDYVSDFLDIINGEDCDIELKPIPMKYIIKRVDNDNEEIILTYDIPGFPEGSLVVPAPISAITKVQFSLPRWDFRDVNGNYVPEGEYEISLVVPDKVEYVINGETLVNEAPGGENYKFKV